MSSPDQKRIDANIKVHEEEARVFSEIHPELYAEPERVIIRSAIERIREQFGSDAAVTILDAASGTGRLAIALLENGFSVTACDVSKDMLDVLKNNVSVESQERLTIVNNELIVFLKNNTDTFHAVVVGAFLHHVKDVESVVTSLLSVIKKDGFLFIVHDPAQRKAGTRFAGRLIEKIDSLLFQIKYFIRKRKFIPRIKEYALSEVHTASGIDDIRLCDMLREHKCSIVKHDRYFVHKTRIMTLIDMHIFKLLPQFYILAQVN